MVSMKSIAKLRVSLSLSQRALASKAGIAYKSLQLIEGGNHNTKLSTLQKISEALRFPKYLFKNHVAKFFALPPDSIAIISRQIVHSKSHEWKIPLFNFVDQFRKTKNKKLITAPPSEDLPPQMLALLACVIESLCLEAEIHVPWWCGGIPALESPYFVAEIENLKALSIMESPPYFRKRNIFVLNNFLERV